MRPGDAHPLPVPRRSDRRRSQLLPQYVKAAFEHVVIEGGRVGQITAAILAGQLTVPLAAVFPIEKIRDAVTLQAGRHVHGKIAVTL